MSGRQNVAFVSLSGYAGANVFYVVPAHPHLNFPISSSSAGPKIPVVSLPFYHNESA